MEELRSEYGPQLGYVLATLQVRLAGDDRDHPSVARVVRVREGLHCLVELLVRLRVCRDQSHVPDLARIRQRLVEVDDPLQIPLLVQELAELPAAALSRRLVTRMRELGDARTHLLREPGQLIEAFLRVGQRKGPLSPVHGDHPTDAAIGDRHADGQNGGAIEPVEVEAQREDAQDHRPANGQRDHHQDEAPRHEPRDDLEDPARKLSLRPRNWPDRVYGRTERRGVSGRCVIHSRRWVSPNAGTREAVRARHRSRSC